MPRARKYPPELLDRGARVVIESGRPIAHVARDLGVPPETLRRHLRRVQADENLRPDLPTVGEREEIKRLRKEVYELRRANEILKAASVFFCNRLEVKRARRKLRDRTDRRPRLAHPQPARTCHRPIRRLVQPQPPPRGARRHSAHRVRTATRPPRRDCGQRIGHGGRSKGRRSPLRAPA